MQAAPDFFCDVSLLAEHLLLRTNNNDGSISREKKGVKIIHMVRNPFALAISNSTYHSVGNDGPMHHDDASELHALSIQSNNG